VHAQCPDCGAFSEESAEAPEFRCGSCGVAHEIERCIHCSIVFARAKIGWGAKTRCPGCDHVYRVAFGSAVRAKFAELAACDDRRGVRADVWDDRSLSLRPLVLLGGFGREFARRRGVPCCVVFNTDAIVATVAPDWVPAEMSYVDVRIDFGGPGAVREGGVFFGGGTTSAGAIEGMALASILSAVTSRTRYQTLIAVSDHRFGVVAMSARTTPDSLRLSLAPVFSRVRQPHSEVTNEVPAAGVRAVEGPGLAAELSQLADLHRAGALTDSEFEAAKARVIAR
jgi:hypothetical protein